MGLHPPGSIYAGGVNFKPVFAAGIIGATHKGRSAHIGNVLHGLAGRQTVGNFDNRTLGVAIQKQITFGVYHHRAANFVRPVVVMGNAAQASFDSAQDNRNVFVGFAAALAVDNGGAVGALAANVTGGVGIIAANFSIRGVAVDHGIHVSRRHTPKQIGLTQYLERFGTLPIGLGNDADAKALGFEHAPDNCHAKTGMVHIRVACHQNNIAAVPAQLVHLCAAHWEKGRRSKTRGPIFAVTPKRLGSTREKRDVNRGVHEKSSNLGESVILRFHT